MQHQNRNKTFSKPDNKKLYSALEAISIVITIIIVSTFFLVFHKSNLLSGYLYAVVGVSTLAVMLYLMHFTFDVVGNQVTYRTLFWSRSIPLADILKVRATRSRGILPGTVIVFDLTPTQRGGQLTGRGEIVSVGRWPLPNAKNWVENVNALCATTR